MIDIYEGTLGVLFERDKLEHELRELTTKLGDVLNYEYQDGDTGLVIVTGKFEEEKQVRPFEHPFIFKDIRGRHMVAIDIRAFMKSNLDDMISVNEKLNDRYNGTLQLKRMVFTRYFLDKEVGWFPLIKPSLLNAFSAIIRQFTLMLTYDKDLASIAEWMAKIHFVTMDEEKEVSLDEAIERLPRTDISKLRHGIAKNVYEDLKKLELVNKLQLPSRTIGSLVLNIKAASKTTRAEGLTSDVYAQVIGRSFYAMNSEKLGIALVENIPTMMSVFSAVIKEGINSRSNMRKIFDSYKTIIKPKDLANIIDKEYENSIIK